MIEPSDMERAELPETSANYMADLEEENKRLTSALGECAAMFKLPQGVAQEIVYEAIASEFNRRQRLANEALVQAR